MNLPLHLMLLFSFMTLLANGQSKVFDLEFGQRIGTDK